MKKTMIMGKNAENTGIGFNNVFSSYIIFKNRYKMARKTSTNRQTHKAHKMKMHMRNYKQTTKQKKIHNNTKSVIKIKIQQY